MLRLTRTVGVVGRAAVIVAAVLVTAALARADGAAEEPVESIAARAMTRAALLDLKIEGTPSARGYAIASRVLEHAHRMSPKDEVILRYLIEACENAGEPERVAEFTRDLVAIDPGDTVAQLRLISAKVRETQNADERLAAYDRWLGPEAAGVDPSVRSRLAVDAALLCRERGDTDGFAKRLGTALTLDATNKDAATLALAFYTQRVSDPAGRFEMMLAVLQADPLDVGLHLSMAEHLASHGAYAGAKRFFATYMQLMSKVDPKGISEDALADSDVCRWLVDGARPLIDEYNRSIFEARKAVQRQRDAAAEAKLPLDGIPTPESIRLKMSTEWVRLAASVALSDDQLIDAAYGEFIESARQEMALAEKAGMTPAPADPLGAEKAKTPEEQAAEARRSAETTAKMRGVLEEAALGGLLANRGIEDLQRAMTTLRENKGGDPEKLANLEGWNLFRHGDLEGAERLLRPLADHNTVAAVGLALIAETRGDKAGASAALQEIARREPGTIPAAFAVTRYRVLTGQPLAPSETASRMDALAAGVPSWLESAIESPRRVQFIDAQLNRPDAGPLDPVRIKVMIRNVSAVPMAVGADGPINSRFLVAPSLQIGTDSIPTGSMLQVATMDRRIRLQPRESFTAEIDADSALLSMLVSQAGSRPSRVRYRLMQGFELYQRDTGAAYDCGPFSLAVECGPVIRPTVPTFVMDMPGLIGLAEKGNDKDVALAILTVRGRMLGFPGLVAPSDQELEQFFTAVARSLPNMSPAGQTLALSLAPPTVQVPTAGLVDAAARGLSSPDARAVFLATRVFAPQDPAMADDLTRKNPDLARLADLVRERLAAKVPSLATYKPQAAAPAGTGTQDQK